MPCRSLASNCAVLQTGSAVPHLYYFNIAIRIVKSLNRRMVWLGSGL